MCHRPPDFCVASALRLGCEHRAGRAAFGFGERAGQREREAFLLARAQEAGRWETRVVSETTPGHFENRSKSLDDIE